MPLATNIIDLLTEDALWAELYGMRLLQRWLTDEEFLDLVMADFR